MSDRYQILEFGRTLRIVDCAEHPPEAAPSVCFIDGDCGLPMVRARALLVCAALNIAAIQYEVEPLPLFSDEPLELP